MKTLVPNQHQNDPKTFLSYQIKDSSALPRYTKCIFHASRTQARDFYENRHTFLTLEDRQKSIPVDVETYGLTLEVRY